jgi:beta-glucosidase/6-phospho-beta-glucosidase/beta-galactosidase
VDFATLKRTLKESAHWYSRVIATNGAALDSVS